MSLWSLKMIRKSTIKFKTYDYPEYEFYRVQRDLICYRLMLYRPDLIKKEHHKELSAHPLHLIALEKRYLFLCKKLKKSNSMVGSVYIGAGLEKSGVRFFLQQFGTKEAIKQFPWT